MTTGPLDDACDADLRLTQGSWPSAGAVVLSYGEVTATAPYEKIGMRTRAGHVAFGRSHGKGTVAAGV